MATHFTEDFQKQSFSSFLDIVANMEFTSSFQNSGEFSQANIPISGPEFPGNFDDNFPGFFSQENRDLIPPTEPISSVEKYFCNGKKRKSVETPKSHLANKFPSSSSGKMAKRENISRNGNKEKNRENEENKKDVVLVRARRGQATDSHSIAERARRGKINERIKCLQNIVPGCYKSMGMAVTLDEIINYVQSLQNQVEFLSMKLTAASTFQDFNFETEQFLVAMQRENTYEAMEMQKVATEGYEGAVGFNQVCPFDLSFGCHPSLPYNK